MSRFSHHDVLSEIAELSSDIIREIRQQLNYYRASVYKHETAHVIRRKVEQLRVISLVVGDELLTDAFRDHDSMVELGGNHCAPGECSFSTRTTQLLRACEKHFERLLNQAKDPAQGRNISKNLQCNLKKHKRQLVSICRHGSRHWAFFQTC